MTWTVWDIVITIVGLLHIVGIIGLLVLVLRIVKGPVAGTAGRVAQVADKGRAVAEATLNALNANRRHVESIVRDVQGAAASLRPSDTAANLPINYRSLRSSLTTLAMVRSGLGAFRSLGKKTSTPPGPASTKATSARLSLPERLGLVPPAAKHVIRFLPYLRIVRTVLQQMKGR
ncbi:MAG: hypothetical protein V4671_10205 [Armatimonadota bacterium]